MEVKLTKKKLGAQNRAQNEDFCNFINFASLVFLVIAQDCSLGEYLTSSRAETSEKDLEVQIRA